MSENRIDLIIDYLRHIRMTVDESIDAFEDDKRTPQYTPEIMHALSESDKQLYWVYQQAIAVRQS